MMAMGGKLSMSKFKEQYDENEDNNMHSENVVLLAENFGTKDDIRDAKTILAKHNAIGSLPYYLMQERDALSDKLYAKYQQASKKKVADGGMMANGGEMDSIYYIQERVDHIEGKPFYEVVDRLEQSVVSLHESKKSAEDWIDRHKYASGGYMAKGGEIKKGDFVHVDNPYWKAAMGTEKPVVRKVTMVSGDDVFFKDGSTSSIKYVSKMEEGGVLA